MAELLAGLPFRLRSLLEFPGVRLPREEGQTYADNARAKACAAAAATRALALADDSGLEVDWLDGRPGVGSARYGGPGLGDHDRVRLLLEELRGVPWARRTARFRCAIAVADPSARVEVVEGAVEGQILEAPRGTEGFGYDAIFYHPPSRASFGELPPAMKNAVSHRAQALVQARHLLLERIRAPAPGDSGRAVTS